MTGGLWRHACLYNRWANLRLLDACAALGDPALEWTAPGTYGTVAATLVHMLSAEQRYVKRLGGSAPSLDGEKGFPGIAELRRHAERSGDELIEVTERLADDATTEVEHDGSLLRLHLWVVAVQALHHGNDHRTHVGTILGAHGVEFPRNPDIDVWSFGVEVAAERIGPARTGH